MLKMTLIVAATAVVGFGAGVWTKSTMADHRPKEATAASTISPFEMQMKVKPNDLPVQYLRGDAYN
jgi:hypothetical protein